LKNSGATADDKHSAKAGVQFAAGTRRAANEKDGSGGKRSAREKDAAGSDEEATDQHERTDQQTDHETTDQEEHGLISKIPSEHVLWSYLHHYVVRTTYHYPPGKSGKVHGEASGNPLKVITLLSKKDKVLYGMAKAIGVVCATEQPSMRNVAANNKIILMHLMIRHDPLLYQVSTRV
jgi:hypothetical protein